MRQDQYEKLQQLEEKLLDVFFNEADPEGWPGAGKKVADMTQQERGDSYWCKKTAAATLALTQRIGVLVGRVQMSGAGTTPTGGTDGEGQDPATAEATRALDADVESAERQAAALLEELRTGRSKARFDQRVHGQKP